MEEVYETLETAYADTTTTLSSKIIEPIVNRKFGNTFHNHNVPKQHQFVHKQTFQQYQSIPFQISKN